MLRITQREPLAASEMAKHERQWDDEGQQWFAELDAEIGAWVEELRPVTA